MEMEKKSNSPEFNFRAMKESEELWYGIQIK
jgi:hypothetical protein